MASEADGAAEVRSQSLWQRTLDRLAQMGAGRAVAWSRLVLAAVALAAIYLDPTQPARFSQITYAILAGYVALAVLVVLAEWRSPATSSQRLAVHVLDITVAAVLVYLTEGPTSPFFTFFTLAMVSGTLSWRARGATVTALVLVAAFIGITAVQGAAGQEVDFYRAAVRTTYLIVAAFLLAYFGWYRERSEQRLQHLAAWPTTTEAGSAEAPELGGALRHAALVLGVRRLLVVWEDQSDPAWHVAHWTGSECLLSQWSSSSDAGPVAEDLADQSFAWSRAAGGTVMRRDGTFPLKQAPIAGSLAAEFGIEDLSAAPFEASFHTGSVIVIEPRPFSPELPTLTELIARRIGIEFEHHRLQSELATAALIRERSRLARDLHDGILQDLTAAGLHLKALSRKVAPEAVGTFTEIIELLMEQQARIRAFVDAMNPKAASGAQVSLATVLETTGSALSRQWRCRIETRVEPVDVTVSATEHLRLRLIIAEAVANAARHGGATAVDIEVRVGERMVIDVRDDGKDDPAHPRDGRRETAPFSLAQRIAEAGGSCRLTLGQQGGHLSIELPRG